MVGARGPRPGPKAAGLGNSAGRVTGPPVAQRYPGREEVGRPRYLEDEGGPRPGSHLRRAPPARPPGPNPTERIQSRRARGRSSGRRSQHPGRGWVHRAAALRDARRTGTESSSLVQKWRRAEFLLSAKGAGGAGPRRGKGTRRTRAPQARAAPDRRLSLRQHSGPLSADQWLGGEEGRGKRGGRRRWGGGRVGGRGGGGEGKRGAPPPFHPTLQSPAHSQPTHIRNNNDAPLGGDQPPLRPRRSRHLQKSLPRVPRHLTGEGARAQGTRGSRAKPPGALGARPAALLRAGPERAPK